MTSKGLVLGLAAALLVSACGGAARPDSRASQPEPTVVERPTISSGIARSATTEMSPTPTTVADPASGEPTGLSPSTTSTTVVPDSTSSANTNPAESIDLAEVRDALDALDALFGDLDTHIGSVDLEEGATP